MDIKQYERHAIFQNKISEIVFYSIFIRENKTYFRITHNQAKLQKYQKRPILNLLCSKLHPLRILRTD